MPKQQASKDKVRERVQRDHCITIRLGGTDHKAKHPSHVDRVSIIIKRP